MSIQASYWLLIHLMIKGDVSPTKNGCITCLSPLLHPIHPIHPPPLPQNVRLLKTPGPLFGAPALGAACISPSFAGATHPWSRRHAAKSTSCAIGIHSAAFAAQEKHPLGHKTKYGGWHPPHFTEDIAMGMLVDRLTRTGSKHLLELNLPCQAPM